MEVKCCGQLAINCTPTLHMLAPCLPFCSSWVVAEDLGEEEGACPWGQQDGDHEGLLT